MDAVRIPAAGRREANRKLRREAILDVAQRSFMANGYAATTMSAVAAALGGSKGTLWSYFPSKEALFTAVIDRATEAFREELTVILNPDEDLWAVLTRFCEKYLAKVTSEEGIAVHRLVVGEVSRFPELGRIFYERAPRATHLMLADYLEEVQRRGTLVPVDPLRAAQQLTWLCMSRTYQMLLFGIVERITPEQRSEDVASAVETFARAWAVA